MMKEQTKRGEKKKYSRTPNELMTSFYDEENSERHSWAFNILFFSHALLSRECF